MEKILKNKRRERQGKKIMPLAILLLGVFLVSLASISAWSNNTFNNSLASENMTFTGIGGTSCYQESANTSNQGGNDGYCKLNYTGTYAFDGYTSSGNTIDGNWNTYGYATPTGVGNITINYTKPNVHTLGAIWQFRRESSTVTNTTIPADCFNYYSDKILLRSSTDSGASPISTDLYCYNGTWELLQHYTTYSFYVYEEGVFWDTGQDITRYLSVPQNTYLINGFLNLSGHEFINYSNYYQAGDSYVGAYLEIYGAINRTRFGQGNVAITNLYIDKIQMNFIKSSADIGTFVSGNLSYKIRKVSDDSILAECNLGYANDTRFLSNWTAHSCDFINTLINDEVFITLERDNISSGKIQSRATNNINFIGSSYTYDNVTSTWSILDLTKDWSFNLTFVESPLFSTNSSLYINNSQVWSYSGTFNQTNNKTSNLASFINTYLNSCSYISSYCYVPFIFHSDTAGILQYSSMTFDTNGFYENSQNYSSSTYETKQESFTLNMSYDSSEWSSISGNLIYDSTSYIGTKSGTGDTVNFTKSLDVKTVSTNVNKTFYWTIYLTNSSGTYLFNSTSKNQTVNNLIFTQCNATYPVTFVNYSIYDETNLGLISTSFDSTFIYWLGDGDVTENSSFSSSADNTSFAFCANVNETLHVSSIINLEASGYDERTYEFSDESFTNTTTYKKLYLLNSTPSTKVIIEVRDAGLTPLQGYLVTIERYYPETGTYAMVISDITDEFGQFVASLIEDTVKYRFSFYDEDGVLKKQTGNVIIACKSTFCIVPFVIESVGTEFDEFKNVTDYEYSLSFNNATNIFTFSWNDLTGESATTRLEVKRQLMNSTTIVCNSPSTSASSSLICDVGSSKANYVAQAFRSVGGEERRIAVLTIEVGSDIPTFGLETLLWVFILLFTLIGVGAFNPTAGAALYGVGFIVFGTLGLISMPLSVFFANTSLVIIFIWAVNKK